jgi:hypothetical protein
MSSMPSLESSIRTCKVDTAWDNRAQSDRFLNPRMMSCPTWTGFDLTGRKVAPDSFYTKSPGCNSAEDRVTVENNVSRPQYMEYITLNAQGLQGHMYGQHARERGVPRGVNGAVHPAHQVMMQQEAALANAQIHNTIRGAPTMEHFKMPANYRAVQKVSPALAYSGYNAINQSLKPFPGGATWGEDWKAQIQPRCSYAPYAASQRQIAQWNREAQAAQCLHGSAARHACSGMN